MKYGFPQISNAKAVKLLCADLERDKKFDLVTADNGKNYSFRRCVDLEELNIPLNTSVLDPTISYSEITAQDRRRIDPRDTLTFLVNFRDKVTNLAKVYGYPTKPFNRNLYGSEFNHKLSVLVWEITREADMTPVNAASDGMWNFLQVVGCPAVACWRWEKEKKIVRNRLIGTSRGAFATAWWRYAVFTDFGEYAYEDWIYKLSEDAIQNILERPGMRGYAPVIIPFAKHIATIQPDQKSDFVKYIRTAAIQLRIKSSTNNFWYLLRKDKNADRIIRDVFQVTDRILGYNYASIE